MNRSANGRPRLDPLKRTRRGSPDPPPGSAQPVLPSNERKIMNHKPHSTWIAAVVYAVALAAGAAYERFRRQINGWLGNPLNK